MPSNINFNHRSSSGLLRSSRHPLQELNHHLLGILSRQMQKSPLHQVQKNGLLSHLASFQFLPEPLVGQLIRRTLEKFPVDLVFDPRHNSPVLIIPSTMVEIVDLTMTSSTVGSKVSMIPKIEETEREICSNWLGISHGSNIDLSVIPESFLNQPVRPSKKIILWNCRGAGKASFLKAVKDIIHEHNPSMVILMETVMSGEVASRIIEMLGFSANFCLDPQGSSSGVWILWKMEDLEVQATSNSSKAIHAIIQLHPSKPSWIPSSPNHEASQGRNNSSDDDHLRRTAASDLNETGRTSDIIGGILDHSYTWTSKGDEQEDLIRELFMKAIRFKQLIKVHPNYYYSILQNRKRNSTKAKKNSNKNHECQKASRPRPRSSLMKLAKTIEDLEN